MFCLNVVTMQSMLVGIFIFVSFIFVAEAKRVKLEDHYGYGKVRKVNVQSLYGYTFTCTNSFKEKKSCRLYRELLLDKDDIIFCDIDISPKYVKGMKVLSNDLVALSGYHKLVDTSEVYDDYEDESSYQLKIRIVNITNCKSIESSISGTISENSIIEKKTNMVSTVANNDGTFETFFNNPEACNVSLCRSSFDTEGNQLKIITLFESNETRRFASVRKINWLEETYILAERAGKKETVTLSLYTADGQEKILTKNNHDLIPAISTTFKTIRLCKTSIEVKSEVSCTIFDPSGNEVSTVKINLKHEVKHIDVENLPNNEFLLFTSTTQWKHSCVTKVTSDGVFMGSLELIGFPECKSSFCISTGELTITKDQYCRTTILIDPPSKSYVFKGKCFEDKDIY